MSAYDILKAEIDTDPLGRGYSGLTDAQVAASINASDRPAPDATSLSATDIFEAIDGTEWAILNPVEKEQLALLLGLDQVLVGPGSNGRAILTSLFGAGSTTRVNLLSLVTGLTQPRWKEIGLPKAPRVGHVINARN